MIIQIKENTSYLNQSWQGNGTRWQGVVAMDGTRYWIICDSAPFTPGELINIHVLTEKELDAPLAFDGQEFKGKIVARLEKL